MIPRSGWYFLLQRPLAHTVAAIGQFERQGSWDDRRRGDDVGVILEDNIDTENDISILPTGWDIVSLGTYNDMSAWHTTYVRG